MTLKPRGQNGTPGYLVKANTFTISRRCAGASERNWLPTLVPLDAADLPTTDNVVYHSVAITQQFLTLSHRQLIQVTDYEVMGQILIADRLVATLVKEVLRSSTLMQCCKEWQGRVRIGQRLRIGIGRHQVQPIVKTPREL